MAKDRNKRFLRNSDGAVAATYALALIPIIAMAGLAWDYTRLVGMDTELQNAADQAALAGATQLDRSAGSMQRAVNAIQNGLVSNSTLLSNDGSGLNVAITDAEVQIVFYETRANAEAGTNGFALSTAATNDTKAGFVQVTVDSRAANFAYTPVVGAFAGNLSASAVAGLGSALCRVPPLMICNPDEPGGDLTMDVASRVGVGFLAKKPGGSQWVPGNYGWLDVGLANGAVGVRQALGWGSAGNCIAQSGADTVETQTGNIANAPAALNTRFDVYENGACETGGDCPAALNSRKDFVRPVTPAPSSLDQSCEVNRTQDGWRLPTDAESYYPNDTGPFSGTPQSMGHPRDKCHAVYQNSADDCRNSSLADGGFGDGDWDRDTYFRTHYVRSDNTRWNAMDWKTNLAGATIDTDGDGTADITLPNFANMDELTRYQLYKWEEANAGAIIDGVTVLGDYTYTDVNGNSRVSHGRPVCSQEFGFGSGLKTPDRRKLTIAVVNCQQEGLTGGDEVRVAQWIDVFLVQTSEDRAYNPGGGNRVFTQKDEIYVEIIGTADVTNTGSVDGITIRRDVPYLVK